MMNKSFGIFLLIGIILLYGCIAKDTIQQQNGGFKTEDNLYNEPVNNTVLSYSDLNSNNEVERVPMDFSSQGFIEILESNSLSCFMDNPLFWQDPSVLLASINKTLEIFDNQRGNGEYKWFGNRVQQKTLIETLIALIDLLKTNADTINMEEIFQTFHVIAIHNVRLTKYYIPYIENASYDYREDYPIAVHGVPYSYVFHPYSGSYRYFDFENGRFSPFLKKHEIIEENRLRIHQAPVLAYLSERNDLENLMLQGTGLIRFNDGSTQMLGYANHNGYSWKQGTPLLDQDRYIFFQEREQPTGLFNQPITPMFSCASDKNLFPFGLLGFILSDQEDSSHQPSTITFIKTDDTGSAFINQPQKLDLFAGYGEEALNRAHSLFPHSYYTVYYLLIKK